MLRKIRNVFLVLALLAVATPPFAAQAAIAWSEIFYDTDSDYGVGYYAAIDYFQIATSDNSDDMIVIISPQYETSAYLFTSSGYGGVFFDTDGDSQGRLFRELLCPNVDATSCKVPCLVGGKCFRGVDTLQNRSREKVHVNGSFIRIGGRQPATV